MTCWVVPHLRMVSARSGKGLRWPMDSSDRLCTVLEPESWIPLSHQRIKDEQLPQFSFPEYATEERYLGLLLDSRGDRLILCERRYQGDVSPCRNCESWPVQVAEGANRKAAVGRLPWSDAVNWVGQDMW